MSEASDAPALLIVKGSFAQYGGAERDVVRQLETWLQVFSSIRIATLHGHPDMEAEAARLGIPVFTPTQTWKGDTSVLVRITAASSRAASRAWRAFLSSEDGRASLDGVDVVHLVSGEGSLEAADALPADLPLHVHMLEPRRGLHGETALWAKIDGRQPRPVALTRLLLTAPRRRDRALVRRMAARQRCAVSGNSPYIQSRIKAVFGLDTGVFLPCVDATIWAREGPAPEPEGHVLTVGRAAWAKGTWECIDMLVDTGLALVHVGGGDAADLERLKAHAEVVGVDLDIAPRLSHDDLAHRMATARAVISFAHGEPFGLTPVEAHAVGTPALMVNDGGFGTTITDGVSGRLLPRNDRAAWHAALEQAADMDARKAWSKAGRERIAELGLDPASRAQDLRSIVDRLLA
ncbi:MAG: glycosyltransferase [Candidatus Thermoplasmatota archaeon]|nr:glycosyltransferase [Candidatus Thermoplasmatota archaeon]